MGNQCGVERDSMGRDHEIEGCDADAMLVAPRANDAIGISDGCVPRQDLQLTKHGMHSCR